MLSIHWAIGWMSEWMQQEGQGGSNGQESPEVQWSREMEVSRELRKGEGFPGGSVVKKLPAVPETWVWSLGWEDPWVGKIPWRRAWKPTPVFLPGESHGQRSLEATVHGVAKIRHDWAAKHIMIGERTSAGTNYQHQGEWSPSENLVWEFYFYNWDYFLMTGWNTSSGKINEVMFNEVMNKWSNASLWSKRDLRVS